MIHRFGGYAVIAVASLCLVGLVHADERSSRSVADQARETRDLRTELGRRMHMAEAQQDEGLYGQALVNLERALELAESLGDPRPTAAVRGALGNARAALGEDALAEQEMLQALEMARGAGADGLAASLANNLANFLVSRGEGDPTSAQQAARLYVTAGEDARRSGDRGLEARIIANQARLELRRGDLESAAVRLRESRALVGELAASPDDVLTRVHLGLSLAMLVEARPGSQPEDLLAAHAVLTRAHEDARKRGDARGSAWAQGTLARIYRHRGHLDEALILARRAVFDAQRAGATEAALRFQLAVSRLLAARGRRDEAIASYGLAVERLVEIRPALAGAYAGGDGSPREEASRAYREMADLLLGRAAAGGSSAAEDRRLTQELLERFKADELRDYFQDDCVDAYQERMAGADSIQGALVVYPVVLPDRLEILATRGGHIEQFTVRVSREELESEIRLLRALLEKRVTRQFLPHAQRVYDWLVRPLEAGLAASPGSTIVFVPDGILRIVPMAALHDGEHFLIERHPVATTPGLALSDPRPIDRSDPKVLLAGLAEAVQGLPALPRVRDELESIQSLYPSDLLFDQRFVQDAFEERLATKDYGIVHIASHGQLGARVEDSYLVTHDGRIELEELASSLTSTRYRDNPVEIITLSACDTAAGDDRAALGLSGLAVRAGARSALGSLWLVNDEAASRLMIAFYTELREPGVSRAEALQRAQQKLIADRRWRHPAYWAPFLLISNWL